MENYNEQMVSLMANKDKKDKPEEEADKLSGTIPKL